MKVLPFISIFIFLGLIVIAVVMNVFLINGARNTMIENSSEYNTSVTYTNSMLSFMKVSPSIGTLLGISAFVIVVLLAGFLINWDKIK